jgi:hypothetical protein
MASFSSPIFFVRWQGCEFQLAPRSLESALPSLKRTPLKAFSLTPQSCLKSLLRPKLLLARQFKKGNLFFYSCQVELDLFAYGPSDGKFDQPMTQPLAISIASFLYLAKFNDFRLA